ncbi:unnamed protein product [Prunus armeniaca]|uniref:Sas10 C-terminal domain-containing protein n=1 Tax=Prunus armeniaca TaxID=36596 RepID=A0A6J5WCK1_PRUAR|nr:unnamed protein product [Prunus armeniaca]
MEDATISNASSEDRVKAEAPQLAAVLKEMKEGLDTVRIKVQALTAKVKSNNYPTVEGISYLEAKHLLLLNYCQSLVYYLLRKARGFSINGHPVVQSLVEIRLFLEKIRPIDKKLQYQIEKLTKVTASTTENVQPGEKESQAGVPQRTDDLLKYRPNPDMLVSKADVTSKDGNDVYRPPKFAPTLMEEDKLSKQDKNALRKEKNTLRQARQSAFVRELVDDLEGRPEEIVESVGAESLELARYRAKMEDRARQEEELFMRAPITKKEKQREKHLKKSRNGLLGLTDNFYDEIKTLPLEDENDGQIPSFSSARGGMGERHKKRKSIGGGL